MGQWLRCACVRVCACARACVCVGGGGGAGMCVMTSQCWQHLFGRKADNNPFVFSADIYLQG